VHPFLPILIVNLAPALSVALLGWNPFPLLLLYWFENLIIGAITLAAILISGFAKGPWHAPRTLFYAAFFMVHYGLFSAAHGGIMWEIFGGGDADPTKLPAAALGWLRGDLLLAWNLLLFAALHVYLFCRDWIGGKQHVRTDPQAVMFVPYGRIVVIHVAILFGGMAILWLGAPAIAVLLLVGLKALLEYFMSVSGELELEKNVRAKAA
jgi:hypothetical protein